MKKEVKKEVEAMCSYSAAIRERAEREGRASSICILLESIGDVPNDLRERIFAEKNQSVLDSWILAAKRSDTIDMFLEAAELL